MYHQHMSPQQQELWNTICAGKPLIGYPELHHITGYTYSTLRTHRTRHRLPPPDTDGHWYANRPDLHTYITHALNNPRHHPRKKDTP